MIQSFTLLLTFFLISITGCNSNSRFVEDYGNISAGPGGLDLVTPAEHPSGWGRRDCMLCHNVSLNVHRSVSSPVDADLIAGNARVQGSSYCLTCHRNNGVN